MKIKIIIFLILFLITESSNSQSVIKGSVEIYKSERISQGASVDIINRVNKKGQLLNAYVNSNGNFKIDTILNGLIDLQFSNSGCYKTIIKNILLNNDTIKLNKIPIFEANYEIEEFYTKRYFFGLIKGKETLGRLIEFKNSKFPANNKIYLKCNTFSIDSILFELNPKTEIIEIQHYNIKNCNF
ncbi:MAG: hypothetical protein JXR51_04830 [Bacteroidales bacterium]|nr:hypothetical protein [Bacteroidales bacterium]MBN2756483.1 hypothetical protein [Bacteroidales bacterium]